MDESEHTGMGPGMRADEQPTAGAAPAEGAPADAAPVEPTDAAAHQPTAGDEPAEGRTDVEAPAGAWKVGGESGNAWTSQLQSMIDNIATQARPVVLEVMAKAAELASVAAEHAGPVAQRAANVTEEVGQKVATRTKEWAADLRQQQGKGPGPTA